MVNRKKHGATIRRKKTHRANKGLNYNKLTIWFGGGILVGIIFMGVIVSNWLQVFQKSENINSVAQSSPIQKPQPDTVETANSKFDFYTLLPKTSTSTHQASNLNNNKSQATSSRTLDLQQTTPSYLVQVGSFKNASDADELRAKLTLQGYSAQSHQIRLKSGQYWYRVSVGPFKNHKLAKSQQEQLESDKFSGTLLVLQQN
ncbi:MAG: SPOR domain-containing protein [Francisellaceae bacterium]|nr:SPOR domain-containing protein [Francisellaceae bacterium]MBT6538719.1 SPOR domain-containing protein [Francisellaceae bacterium]